MRALQTRMDFLTSLMGLVRGQELRDRELADLFTYEVEGIGPDRAVCLCSMSKNGKVNENNNIEWISFLRTRNPFVCAQGAHAFYLVSRWEIGILGFFLQNSYKIEN